MKRILILLVFLSGCATQTLEKGLPYLVGKPIDAAVNVLGLPNGQTNIAGFTVYEWSNQRTSTVPIYQTNTSQTTGMVGTTPVYGTTTTGSTNYVPVSYQCSIKLAVDGSGIIQRWEYYGNQGGCARYSKGVKTLIPEQ